MFNKIAACYVGCAGVAVFFFTCITDVFDGERATVGKKKYFKRLNSKLINFIILDILHGIRSTDMTAHFIIVYCIRIK